MRKLMFCRYQPGHRECQPLERSVISNLKPESIGYLKKDNKILPVYRQFDYSIQKHRYLIRIKQDDWVGWRNIDLGYEPLEGKSYNHEGESYTYHQSESLLGINANSSWYIPVENETVKNQKGLYFIGECVDVTGWLGGYNFQWAWSSGWVAGQSIRNSL